MRIAVMGAGGVGGYFGGRLAQAGHEVAFVARGKHLEAMRAKGLSLKSPLGDATIKVKAAENPAELGQAEVVLFAVKLWDTESAAERIRPLVAKGGIVIPFQNGVESIERVGSVLGAERVMGGAAYIAGRIGEPGVIVQTGTMARLRFGPVLPAQRKTAEAFLAACKEAKIDCELTDDIVRVLWEKFVLLVAISATTAVTRKTIGVVRTDPDYPLSALRRRTEGWVKVQFSITATGMVGDAIVVDAAPENVFEAAALKAIGRWRYEPKVVNGVPVERAGMQTLIRFRLEE